MALLHEAPDGWDDVAPQLEEFANQMRDAVNEPHEGKRRNEGTWKITKIHWERSRRCARSLGLGGQVCL